MCHDSDSWTDWMKDGVSCIVNMDLWVLHLSVFFDIGQNCSIQWMDQTEWWFSLCGRELPQGCLHFSPSFVHSIVPLSKFGAKMPKQKQKQTCEVSCMLQLRLKVTCHQPSVILGFLWSLCFGLLFTTQSFSFNTLAFPWIGLSSLHSAQLQIHQWNDRSDDYSSVPNDSVLCFHNAVTLKMLWSSFVKLTLSPSTSSLFLFCCWGFPVVLDFLLLLSKVAL